MLQFSGPRFSSAWVLPAVSAGIWGAATASVVFWGLQWPQNERPVAAFVFATSSTVPQDLGVQVARALGQQSRSVTGAAQSTNHPFQLLGVVAAGSGDGGALIAAQGQAPQAFRVGQIVQDGWILVSLTARQARLQSSEAEVLLELPPQHDPLK